MLLRIRTTNETDVPQTAATNEVQDNVTGCTVSRSIYRVK